ncbi:HugZ family protein [Celeribacter sp. PS-C1]|uniref:HugZ family pyridoxamine 5'-phosphate oxidase n=1 Tax=Celeribacter sp. PS-C1 TaxID=2820813 RepID=UPI001CA4C20F|nr:pyridoxamine 5'-phosphate oxidase family protein [Celeribacter sp. PS-C1]MBW6418667.1 pyridoxamine 5'-phosphate oxidase family protein [Celeribacter sp. PS-C1]
MTKDSPSPIRPTDDDARGLARGLIQQARIAALAVLDPESGAPHVTRVAFGLGAKGQWLTLVSDLAFHTRALRATPQVGLLLGEAPTKGDPLAFPRLSAQATPDFISRNSPEHAAHRAAWLEHHPKSALYVDFADFSFVTFTPISADLNGGFGKAYRLRAQDMQLDS